MICKPLALHEQAANSGFTHFCRVTADDLTQATANTAQTLTLMTLVAGDVMERIMDYVAVPFQATSDPTAFNTTTRSLGDNTGVATHVAAGEANVNQITAASTMRLGNTPVGPYTAANTVTVTFNAMSAKSLNTINKGELHIFVKITRIKQISAGQTAAVIAKT